MLNNLDKLTICIFTFNRPKELIRLIDYWSQYKVQIIVMDASSKNLKINKSLNLDYFNVPHLSLQQRLIKFSENIKTEYMMLSPDDDFFFPRGLNETIEFLDRNQDFSSAQGLRIRFYDNASINWIPDYLAQAKLNFNNEDKTLRLMEMYKPMHYIYSVLRTSNYKKIINCLQGVHSTKRDSLMMNEYIFNYTLPLLGKHSILPVLYSARKAHEYLGGDINFSAWINDINDSDAMRYKRNIIDFYTNELNCNQSTAKNLFDLITFDFSINKESKNKENSRIIKTLRKVFFESRYRIPYYITKTKYLRFFWILVLNKNLLLGLSDFRNLRIFLKHNRLQ
jgi:glycosyltransferase domain-containing protein